MSKTILCIAAHPDDEALGCGGTLAKHAADGDDVHIVFLADGVGARGSKLGLAQREAAAKKAAETLGAEQIRFLSMPDNQLDTVSLLEVVQAVEKEIAEIEPHIIYTHHAGDLNIDHKITAQAVMTACRPLPGSKLEAIYAFEVLSSTGWDQPNTANVFIPQHFVEITEQFDQKIKALECYGMEMRDFPHARSYEAVEALAVHRGSHVGVARAEAFMTLRSLWV